MKNLIIVFFSFFVAFSSANASNTGPINSPDLPVIVVSNLNTDEGEEETCVRCSSATIGGEYIMCCALSWDDCSDAQQMADDCLRIDICGSDR